MNRLGPASTNKWQIPLNPVSLSLYAPHKHTSPRQTFGSSNVIKHNFVDLLPSKVPFNQAAGRKEGALRGELQVASVSSLRRSDRAVILPAGPPPVLLWQPVIIHRRDALSCRFQPRCKWTQMGSDRDQANNVLFICFASFLFFLFTFLCVSTILLLPFFSLCFPLRWTVESTGSTTCLGFLWAYSCFICGYFHPG